MAGIPKTAKLVVRGFSDLCSGDLAFRMGFNPSLRDLCASICTGIWLDGRIPCHRHPLQLVALSPLRQYLQREMVVQPVVCRPPLCALRVTEAVDVFPRTKDFQDLMSIGPVFDCSPELSARLADVLAAERVHVGMTRDSSSCGGTALTFRRGLMARIKALRQVRDGRVLLWLVSTKAHALNPLFWYFDITLTKSIARTLEQNGAKRIEWEDWAALWESQ